MKKIYISTFLFLFVYSKVLSQCFPTVLCGDTTITYPPGTRECNFQPNSINKDYGINVVASHSFSSSWSVSNCLISSFKVYGPFTDHCYPNETYNSLACYNLGTPVFTAPINVTNVNFSANPYLQVGTYLIYITYSSCHPILNVDIEGISCSHSSGTGVMVSLPFTYTPAIIDTSSTEVPCENCETFQPIAGNDYWLSAWVKEDHTSQVKSYLDSYVELTFTSSGVSALPIYTTGEIIDGWQRIVGKFTVPIGTTDIHIDLVNNSGVDAYFDDVRIHPFNGSMKSYVYDPETLWLNAELDDNNYATVYEYDKEGGLVRIKKETSRGMVTIQETRSNTQKQH